MNGEASSPAERRFGGINRLYGEDALSRLQAMTVAVIGIGGVGSWAAEALARSGVGHLILVDLDHIAESNINRQIHADQATLGMAKVEAMANRIRSYANTRVTLVDAFAEPDNLAGLFPSDLLLDGMAEACDQVNAKVALAAFAKSRRIPIVMAGAAGGKTKPWLLQVDDLSRSMNDPLLAKVRYQLRKNHGFPGGGGDRTKYEKIPAMGLTVVYSTEQVRRSEACDPSAGLACAGYGSVVTVTGSMGFSMSAWLIDQLLSKQSKVLNQA